LQSSVLPIETFPALERVPAEHGEARAGARPPCIHGFVRRIPGIELSHDKTTVLENLDQVHAEARRVLGLSERKFVTARQIHGDKIAVINVMLSGDKCFEGCDGLVTNQRDVCLGVYVADCCAVYLVDQNASAVGLVHSGKKGTALGIVRNAIRSMREEFGIDPGDLIAQLSPCIRPPHYEIDFAAEIVRQCYDAGIEEVHASGVCTACDLEHYYSYRAEKGKTGRMLALLAL
jgi:polyphenol oxidase